MKKTAQICLAMEAEAITEGAMEIGVKKIRQKDDGGGKMVVIFF